ncbi:MAG: SpoIID/LytB domain-containing protein [Bacteroidetes bacterium]|nr:SpoIID/LytB domain-containing protein [Bacteroidota bacterium]
MSISKRTVVKFCGMLIIFAGCSGASVRQESTAGTPDIRVCIADRAHEVTIGIVEGAVLQTVEGRYALDGFSEMRCVLEEDGAVRVVMDGRPARTFRGVARCFYRERGHEFTIEKRIYADTLLIASDGSGLYVINVLPLEEYLKSVLPREIGRNRKSDEINAILAQAILARTYAMTKISLPLTRLFDVYDDTRDQVFGGLTGRDALTTLAVERSKGQVLTYGGTLAECYFHSTCGGHTEASSLVWRRPQSKPYLRGIRDSGRHTDYCRISPSYRWSEEYSREEIEATLRAFLPSANDAILPSDIPAEKWYLLDMLILKRGVSGRVTLLQVIMGNRMQQRSYYLHGDRIRWALRQSGGSRPLRSTLFDVTLSRNAAKWIERVRFDGGGSGHGVGFCQWGAIGMARAGYSVDEILKAYFPGTSMKRSY